MAIQCVSSSGHSAGFFCCGDRVFLTSTNYDWQQAEEAPVVECLECSPTQVKIECHYPVHFYMCEDVDGYENPPYVRDNSIHESFARCVTVHGTHGLTVQDNVGYKAMGHCFFLEDGGEKRTVFDGNLGASVQAGSLVPTDGVKNFSVFWVTRPKTYLRNNVAAGSACTRTVNGMHGYADYGYQCKSPGELSSDSASGVTFVGGNGNRNYMSTSIMLGDSPNKGEPLVKDEVAFNRSFPKSRTNYPMIGYMQYGTPVKVATTWFEYFATTESRHAGAIGFIRHHGHPTSPHSSLENLSWGSDDGVGLDNRLFDEDDKDPIFAVKEDGDRTQTYRDLDGSTTGTADTMIFLPRPIRLTDKCYARENWKLAAFPHRYGKINPENYEKSTTAILVRDDIPTVQDHREKTGGDFLVILRGLYSYTLHWTTSTPGKLEVIGRGVEKDYHVRIGICLPRDAEFELTREKPFKAHPEDWTSAGSVEEIDKDETGRQYYWDNTTGLLFVKLLHTNYFEDGILPHCPGGGCGSVHITLLKGTLSGSDCSTRAYGPYSKTITVQKTLILNTIRSNGGAFCHFSIDASVSEQHTKLFSYGYIGSDKLICATPMTSVGFGFTCTLKIIGYTR